MMNEQIFSWIRYKKPNWNPLMINNLLCLSFILSWIHFIFIFLLIEKKALWARKTKSWYFSIFNLWLLLFFEAKYLYILMSHIFSLNSYVHLLKNNLSFFEQHFTTFFEGRTLFISPPLSKRVHVKCFLLKFIDIIEWYIFRLIN